MSSVCVSVYPSGTELKLPEYLSSVLDYLHYRDFILALPDIHTDPNLFPFVKPSGPYPFSFPLASDPSALSEGVGGGGTPSCLYH